MDSSNSRPNALKITADPSRQRPQSFPAPPHFSYLSSLPESRLRSIPPDLVIQILSRLPTNSLLEFRRICKPWRDSIDLHFALSFQNWRIAIKCYHGVLFNLKIHSQPDCFSMVELRNPVRKKKIGGTEYVEMPWFGILGSCKGLLLIKHDVDLYLWNPSITQCTKVVSLPREDRLRSERILVSSGLCYDSSNDEYKAVLAYEGITAVVSLKSRRWTRFCFPYKLNLGPVVNDRLHWVVNRDENDTQSPTQQIFYFDPLVDEFVEFSTPLPSNGGRNVILGLGVLDGCICVARYCDCESVAHNIRYSFYEQDIEVVIMKEYGVEESWTSLFVISQFERLSQLYGSLVPLCLTKDGKVLIAVYGTRILVYDPLGDSRYYIPNLNKIPVKDVFLYEDSVVSPDSYGGGNDLAIDRVDDWNLIYDSDSGKNGRTEKEDG